MQDGHIVTYVLLNVKFILHILRLILDLHFLIHRSHAYQFCFSETIPVSALLRIQPVRTNS